MIWRHCRAMFNASAEFQHSHYGVICVVPIVNVLIIWINAWVVSGVRHHGCQLVFFRDCMVAISVVS